MKSYNFKYQFFQIYKIDHTPTKTEIQDNSVYFYENETEAREKQTLELFRLLTGNYKPYNNLEKSTTEYFKKFIWVDDIGFAISTVTNNQLTEEQYNYYISKIKQNNPEKLI